MFFVSEGSFLVACKCESCGFDIPVVKEYCKQTLSGYKTNKPLPCKNCGNLSDEIFKGHESYENNDVIKCPKCKSTQLTANNKGFGLGKAAVGGLLLGPVGLLGGAIGSKKIMISCLRCGNRWEAGDKK